MAGGGFGGGGGRRCRSEAAPRIRASFLVSPQRRIEDAQSQLHVSTRAEQAALLEELQGWYFAAGEFAEAAEPGAAQHHQQEDSAAGVGALSASVGGKSLDFEARFEACLQASRSKDALGASSPHRGLAV